MNNRNPSGSDDKFRQRAEEIARLKAVQSPDDIETLSSEDTRKILHELRVHQIELEMQNEELRKVQSELETGRIRYLDLYDMAPVGYLTLTEKELILEANLTAATLLGVDRTTLIHQPISRFIFKEDQDIYYLHRKQLFESGKLQVCEMRMVPENKPFFLGTSYRHRSPKPHR